MRPLTLCNLFRSDYNTSVACTYIFYTLANRAYDHNDNEFGSFMPSNQDFSYDQHMREVIVPLINQGLLRSDYQTAFIDHYNQSPQPFLAITRRDNAELSDIDLKTISSLVKNTLARHNYKNMPPRLFSKHLGHDLDALTRMGIEHTYPTRRNH